VRALYDLRPGRDGGYRLLTGRDDRGQMLGGEADVLADAGVRHEAG
jgi:hypothetical protein